MNDRVNRRQFTSIVASGAAASLCGSWAAIGASASRTTVTRKDLGTLSISSPDLVALATAYEEMNDLPDSHPHSWTFQAKIHGTGGTVPMALRDLWRTCQHGNWWFFPWHRAYLYFFERIVRKYSGYADFALPYWHWDSTSSNQRRLHPVFCAAIPFISGSGPLPLTAGIHLSPRLRLPMARGTPCGPEYLPAPMPSGAAK